VAIRGEPRRFGGAVQLQSELILGARGDAGHPRCPARRSGTAAGRSRRFLSVDIGGRKGKPSLSQAFLRRAPSTSQLNGHRTSTEVELPCYKTQISCGFFAANAKTGKETEPGDGKATAID
jgi:hypothetical protein